MDAAYELFQYYSEINKILRERNQTRKFNDKIVNLAFWSGVTPLECVEINQPIEDDIPITLNL